MNDKKLVIGAEDQILVTGASGFIGTPIVSNLLKRGFINIRCLVRDSSNITRLENVIKKKCAARVEIIVGNLLSRNDCSRMARNSVLIYHLAAGTGTKAFSEAFLNSVVSTRNLLDATIESKCLRRFVNVSSFTVYTNRKKPRWRLLDEDCPTEKHPESRALAYCYGKVKQEALVVEYGKKFGTPYVNVRPGCVYGPGSTTIPGRIGIDPFGFFIHMGGSNRIPFSYVDNCADAIVLAGLIPNIEGEVFNVVDDDLPTSRKFLRLYKKNVEGFHSVFIPHVFSYIMCFGWEIFSKWSKGQLTPAYTRREWAANWKKTFYTNKKIKSLLGWSQRIPTAEGLRRYFKSWAYRTTDFEE